MSDRSMCPRREVTRIGILVPGVGGEVVELMSHALDGLAQRMILSGSVGAGGDDRPPWLCSDYVLHNREHGGDGSAGTGQQQRGIRGSQHEISGGRTHLQDVANLDLVMQTFGPGRLQEVTDQADASPSEPGVTALPDPRQNWLRLRAARPDHLGARRPGGCWLPSTMVLIWLNVLIWAV
jgi:hypothetical protein